MTPAVLIAIAAMLLHKPFADDDETTEDVAYLVVCAAGAAIVWDALLFFSLS